MQSHIFSLIIIVQLYLMLLPATQQGGEQFRQLIRRHAVIAEPGGESRASVVRKTWLLSAFYDVGPVVEQRRMVCELSTVDEAAHFMRFASAVNGPLMVNTLLYDQAALPWTQALRASLAGSGVPECFIACDRGAFARCDVQQALRCGGGGCGAGRLSRHAAARCATRPRRAARPQHSQHCAGRARDAHSTGTAQCYAVARCDACRTL